MPQAAPVMHVTLQMSWWAGLLESRDSLPGKLHNQLKGRLKQITLSNLPDDSDNTKEENESNYIDSSLPDDSDDGLEQTNEDCVFLRIPIFETYCTPFMTINYKVDFYYVHCGRLGFKLIIGVAQSCRSGNHARFILEHIFIANQQQNFIVLNISRFKKKFKWTL